MASTETLNVGNHAGHNEQMKRPQQPPPKIPPRTDLHHPKPSAPPLHLLQQDNNNFNETIRPPQRLRQNQQWNKQNHDV